jgi:DnaJ-class molecular chaperone
MVRQPEPSAVDLYARLGIAPDASKSQITAAYRRLVRALHPDSAQTPGGSPAQLRLIIEAHRILSDPKQRERYDSTTSQLAQTISRSQPITTKMCPVCRGTATIAHPCHRCTGTGHILANSPWLRTPGACPVCHARGYDLARCGACGGTGQTSTR